MLERRATQASRNYVRQWQVSTGEKARSQVGSSYIFKGLLEIKKGLEEDLKKGIFDQEDLDFLNKVYMGIYDFSSFPDSPSPDKAGQN